MPGSTRDNLSERLPSAIQRTYLIILTADTLLDPVGEGKKSFENASSEGVSNVTFTDLTDKRSVQE